MFDWQWIAGAVALVWWLVGFVAGQASDVPTPPTDDQQVERSGDGYAP